MSCIKASEAHARVECINVPYCTSQRTSCSQSDMLFQYPVSADCEYFECANSVHTLVEVNALLDIKTCMHNMLCDRSFNKSALCQRSESLSLHVTQGLVQHES